MLLVIREIGIVHLSLRHDPHSRPHGTPYSALKVLMPRNSFHSAHDSASTDCALLQSASSGTAVDTNKERE